MNFMLTVMAKHMDPSRLLSEHNAVRDGDTYSDGENM